MAGLKGDAKVRYVARMFARAARRYDLLNTVMSGGFHHRWRRLAARLATQGLRGPALDVATGTGDFAFALAKQSGIQTVVGVDLVGEMVELARQKAQHRKMARQVTWLLGDALALPFREDTFACVTSGFGMRNVTDVPAAMAEMARVVRPGGRVAVLEMVPLETRGLLDRVKRLYFRRVIPLLGAVLAGNREAYSYLPQSVNAFYSFAEVANMMKEVGLEVVCQRRVGMRAVGIIVGEKR
ncbi:MAG: ubiquinone/menaquinone biosynthesis methyltransferase [Chloroflexi bacterium]|nr:ubiquinone/menaquinone biosynthesis methyltransferase [Chloroflexota bacterium]